MAEWKSVSFEDGVDTKIATHAGNASAHHTKYTDAEAVSAVATADDYIKNDADDLTSGNIEIAKTVPTLQLNQPHSTTPSQCGIFFFQRNRTGGVLSGDYLGFERYYGKGTDGDYHYGAYLIALAEADAGAAFVPVKLQYGVTQTDGTTWTIGFDSAKRFYLTNGIIKDPKNHTHSALSGTKKLVEIDIGGTPYYFEVYPTKA